MIRSRREVARARRVLIPIAVPVSERQVGSPVPRHGTDGLLDPLAGRLVRDDDASADGVVDVLVRDLKWQRAFGSVDRKCFPYALLMLEKAPGFQGLLL